jgi:hypothetical protein
MKSVNEIGRLLTFRSFDSFDALEVCSFTSVVFAVSIGTFSTSDFMVLLINVELHVLLEDRVPLGGLIHLLLSFFLVFLKSGMFGFALLDSPLVSFFN